MRICNRDDCKCYNDGKGRPYCYHCMWRKDLEDRYDYKEEEE